MSAVSEVPEHLPLLALPDPCLLAVLQCCAAEEQRSLLSAARAHSRLHKAAAVALSSVNANVRQQQQLDSVLLYLDRHGSHVNSLKLSQPLTMRWGRPFRFTLRHLPSTLQLQSLELSGWDLQLLSDNGSEGVLAAAVAAGAPPLKQLQLDCCELLDGAEGLAAALLQLPALEHLCIFCNCIYDCICDCDCNYYCNATATASFATGVLQQLQQLTYLELAGDCLQGPDEASPDLQPLTALARLVDLRLRLEDTISASMLSSVCHLTRLVMDKGGFEPGALAGKPKLQHLELTACSLYNQHQTGGLWVAELLSQLQHQTQLTYLCVGGSMMRSCGELYPPAAAYAALTASSKLQHLSISWCKLPPDVWEHLFPAGRQLLHLTSLDISKVKQQLPYGAALAPDGSRLASCCPSLQSLDMSNLQYSPQQLTQLQGLSGLHSLHLVIGKRGKSFEASTDTGDTLQAVAQLTGLRELHLSVYNAPMQLLVTQLQLLQYLLHLTVLEYEKTLLKQKVGWLAFGAVIVACQHVLASCTLTAAVHALLKGGLLTAPAGLWVQSTNTCGVP
jgi:hypothetical protein